LVIEVSALTPLVKLEVAEPEHYVKAIKVGRHGLLVEDGYFSGLLLPQVPVKLGWDEKEFLCQTCVKAGMPPNAWESKRASVYSFEAQIFCEKAPGGEVEERVLGGKGED
ncbi:MAG: TIGR00296 family protein, partial [Candidatus Aenigmarchaeota archaeon]|nr:TIGR00296 family protein [Candidatus Aenigmarchaeota archaeon]